MVPTITRSSGTMAEPWPRFDSGYCCSSWLAIAAMLAAAASTVTPSRSRATPYRLWHPRLNSHGLLACSASQKSAGSAGAK
jgi:hypothetical protein